MDGILICVNKDVSPSLALPQKERVERKSNRFPSRSRLFVGQRSRIIILRIRNIQRAASQADANIFRNLLSLRNIYK